MPGDRSIRRTRSKAPPLSSVARPVKARPHGCPPGRSALWSDGFQPRSGAMDQGREPKRFSIPSTWVPWRTTPSPAGSWTLRVMPHRNTNRSISRYDEHSVGRVGGEERCWTRRTARPPARAPAVRSADSMASRCAKILGSEPQEYRPCVVNQPLKVMTSITRLTVGGRHAAGR